MPRKTVKPKYFISATLAQTFNNLSSALTGAAITVPALAEPFIAAGVAVGVIRCFLLFFKGAHGLVVPPRHWYFFPTEKELSPRGYERSEIIICLVTPSNKKFIFACCKASLRESFFIHAGACVSRVLFQK